MDFPEDVEIDGYTLGSSTKQGIGTIPVLLPTSNDNSTPTLYLIYGVSNNSTEPEWYRYDAIDDTLQRYYSESLNYSNEIINTYTQLKDEHNKVFDTY